MLMSETVFEIRIYLTALKVILNQGSQLQFPVHNILIRQFVLLTDTTPTLRTQLSFGWVIRVFWYEIYCCWLSFS
jgi:hypothetical protein